MSDATPPGEVHVSTQAPCVIVSIIILSYNTREMTLKCLRTLHESLGGLSAEVWLVDNASTDGSAAAVREAFPNVKLLANEKNVGFALEHRFEAFKGAFNSHR